MRALVLTSLYPNAVHRVFGNFVHQRVLRIARIETVFVVAPVRWRFRRSRPIPAEETLDGLKISHPRFFVIPGVLKWTDWLLMALSIWPRVARMARSCRPDIVDAHWGYPDGVAAFFLSRMLRLPLVITVRGSDINVFLQERMRGAILRYVLRRAERIIAVSDSLKRSLIASGVPESQVIVVRNGIDTDVFVPANSKAARESLGLVVNDGLILCIGNLVSIKGQDILLAAFARMSNDDVQLVLVGDGPERAHLEGIVSRFPGQVKSRVTFVGSQPHDRIPVWLSAADIVCIPSRNEGLPNVALEALACGRPVVASRVGGVEEVISSDELGATVEAGNADALALALDAALSKAWSVHALRTGALRFSWTETASRCAAVWREAIEMGKEGR
jgi:glycosyltransferase involved in cell wall biosynthesis